MTEFHFRADLRYDCFAPRAWHAFGASPSLVDLRRENVAQQRLDSHRLRGRWTLSSHGQEERHAVGQRENLA